MIVIDDAGPRSRFPFDDDRINPTLCLFEFVYFARPDTFLGGRGVHRARVRMGEVLSTQQPVEADMVMGVPESGMPAAEGYARASGIPYGQGLVKNRYIGRTFIAPSQEVRSLGVDVYKRQGWAPTGCRWSVRCVACPSASEPTGCRR